MSSRLEGFQREANFLSFKVVFFDALGFRAEEDMSKPARYEIRPTLRSILRDLRNATFSLHFPHESFHRFIDRICTRRLHLWCHVGFEGYPGTVGWFFVRSAKPVVSLLNNTSSEHLTYQQIYRDSYPTYH
jgi:hypothetical protein